MNLLYIDPHSTINHWFEPIFPYNLIFDLATYLISAFIFFFIYKYKIINKNLFFISIISLLTPFLFNGFLIHWSYLPDQTKYLSEGKLARENFILYFLNTINYSNSANIGEYLNDLKLKFPAIIYQISPIVSFETFKGIALWNRALYLLMIIFLIKKNYCDNFFKLIFFLSPSLIIYSSVSLRDNLIIICMVLFLYFFFENKKKGMFLSIIFLIIMKIQNLVVILTFILLKNLFSNSNKRILMATFVIIFGTVIIIIKHQFILDVINGYRYGFYSEEYGQYKSMSAQKIYEDFYLKFDLNSLTIVINQYIEFILSPYRKPLNIFTVIILFENIVFYLIYFITFYKNYNSNKRVSFIWLGVLLISYLMISVLVINDAQIHRYKTPIIIFILFGYFYSLKKDVKKISK